MFNYSRKNMSSIYKLIQKIAIIREFCGSRIRKEQIYKWKIKPNKLCYLKRLLITKDTFKIR